MWQQILINQSKHIINWTFLVDLAGAVLPFHPMFGYKTQGIGPSPRGNIPSRCGMHPSLRFERTGASHFFPSRANEYQRLGATRAGHIGFCVAGHHGRARAPRDREQASTDSCKSKSKSKTVKNAKRRRLMVLIAAWCKEGRRRSIVL